MRFFVRVKAEPQSLTMTYSVLCIGGPKMSVTMSPTNVFPAFLPLAVFSSLHLLEHGGTTSGSGSLYWLFPLL